MSEAASPVQFKYEEVETEQFELVPQDHGKDPKNLGVRSQEFSFSFPNCTCC